MDLTSKEVSLTAQKVNDVTSDELHHCTLGLALFDTWVIISSDRSSDCNCLPLIKIPICFRLQNLEMSSTNLYGHNKIPFAKVLFGIFL